MKRAFVEMIVLISISSLIGMGINYLSPRGIPLFGQWDATKGSTSAGGRCQSHSPEVSDNDMDASYLDLDTTIIDARSRELYIEGHIPRAISCPLGEFQNYRDELLDTIPLNTKLIVYCIGIDCQDSHDLLKMLENIGYTSVRVYAKGYDGWVARNRPTRLGEQP